MIPRAPSIEIAGAGLPDVVRRLRSAARRPRTRSVAIVLWLALLAGPGDAVAACPPAEPSCPYIDVAVIGKTGQGVFRFPQAVALSPGGDVVYVADQFSAMVQKFDRAGTFLAQWGAFGDGAGQITQVGGLAADRSGRVYVLDSLNDRVEVFSSTGDFIGQWGTFGTQPGQFDLGINGGIAVLDDPSAGLFAYIADQDNHRIQRIALDPSSGLPDAGVPIVVWGSFADCAVFCTPSQFNHPQGVAVSTSPNQPHDVFVADDDNHRVQKFSTDGAFIAQIGTPGVAGSGEGQFAFPYDVGVDQPHALYVADNNNHRVQKFDAGSLAFLTLWGGFGSASGQLEFPRALSALASDPQGGVYVADTANNRIQAFDAQGTVVGAWGESGRGPGNFTRPAGVVVDRSGNLYAADTFNHRIEKFSPAGAFLQEWGRKNNAGYPASGTGAGEFNNPARIAADPRNGDVYVADTANNRVQRLAAAGGTWSVVAGSTFSGPEGVAVDAGGTLYVADTGNKVVKRRDGTTGTWSTLSGQAFTSPRAVAVDAARNVYVADTGANAILRFDVTSGTWSQVAPSESFQGPTGVAVDADGRVVVADTDNHSIARVSPSGAVVRWGSYGPEVGRLVRPAAVTTDAVGNVYVADTFNNRLQKFVFSTAPPPSPDFTLSVSPSTLTVTRGGARRTATVTIASTGGFNSQVTLTAPGCPARVTCTFSPNPASASSTLSVRARSGAATGTFTVTVTGTGGGLTRTTPLTLVVQ
jgi:DNA-binding beta-propeller fold protein YncE